MPVIDASVLSYGLNMLLFVQAKAVAVPALSIRVNNAPRCLAALKTWFASVSV